MAYQFAPYPAITDPILKATDSGLSKAQLDRLVGYGDVCVRLQNEQSRVGFGAQSRYVPELRNASVAWLGSGLSETQWVYQWAEQAIQNANSLFWQYDLWGLNDLLHYIIYRGDDKGHFTWHMDMGDNYNRPQRKLSFVLTLSQQGEDYDGGEFQIFNGGRMNVKAARERGTLLVFPSWVQHSVSPVTDGERRSLVGWVSGMKFR